MRPTYPPIEHENEENELDPDEIESVKLKTKIRQMTIKYQSKGRFYNNVLRKRTNKSRRKQTLINHGKIPK